MAACRAVEASALPPGAELGVDVPATAVAEVGRAEADSVLASGSTAEEEACEGRLRIHLQRGLVHASGVSRGPCVDWPVQDVAQYHERHCDGMMMRHTVQKVGCPACCTPAPMAPTRCGVCAGLRA